MNLVNPPKRTGKSDVGRKSHAWDCSGGRKKWRVWENASISLLPEQSGEMRDWRWGAGTEENILK